MRVFLGLVLLCFTCKGPLVANQEIAWLEKYSMLHQAEELARIYSGKKDQWQHPYGTPNPKRVIEKASNWFTAYPSSILTEEGATVLCTLSNRELWKIFQEIGIQAMHTGPMKVAGGLVNGKRAPSTDGGFDRIGFQIDPQYGTYQEYLKMTETAKNYGGIIIGDLVPGHTGLGPDFLLALKNYKDYPGIYHLIEVDRKDWKLLPEVPKGSLSSNLNLKEVREFHKRGYISGLLERIIFAEPHVKESNYSATHPVRCVDGITRRWIYLHYFKSGQPSLNWLDPSFAANRMLAGDVIISLHELKNAGLRLDANGFLGIERILGTKNAWSEGHPLSVGASDSIAQLIRKLGGFSFQELNLGPLTVKAFLENGADLSYDFLTRSAYLNALIHGNVDLLKISYDLLKKYKLEPISFIHALQNHDEFNYEMNHLKDLAEDFFPYRDRSLCGYDLQKDVFKTDLDILTEAFYNLYSDGGPCGTMIGLIAGALGIADVYKMSKEEKMLVQKAHLLLTFFNAMQPGVFAVSAWDLVGALPLKKEEYGHLTAKDGDKRWISRGAYDLLGCSKKEFSEGGLKRAKTLYGPLPKQMKNPQSFVSKLRNILKIRGTSNIATAEWLGSLPSKNEGVLLLLHRLPGTGFLEVTAINFSRKKVSEKVTIRGIENTTAINLMTRKSERKEFSENCFQLMLEPLEGKAIFFQEKAFQGF